MKYLGIILILILSLSCEIESSYPEADWTLMFYLGDDTYSPLTLTNDISELTYNTSNTTNLRIIILYDGDEDGDSKIEVIDDPFTLNSRDIPISNTGITQDSFGDIDMSDSETLEQFVRYTQSKLPAKKYAIYFGSHGTGYTGNFISGLQVESPDNQLEYLEPSEISTAISANENVNLLVFDACNMGNIETVYELSSVTDYVIASPELIPGPGNDYTALLESALTLSDPEPYDLGKTTLEVYYNYYSQPDNSDTFNGHQNHSLNNLYDTELIKALVESNGFQSTLTSVTVDNSVTTFNDNNYINLFEILSSDDLNSAVTTADEGLYQWLSIYYPGSSYNSSYEETAFAQEVDGWVTKITQ